LIIDSDNVANAALAQLLGDKKLAQVYEDLRVHLPEENGTGYTAEEYSHVFRVLFNATYLSRSSSENVLALLTKTNFDNGLIAKLPSAAVVAHKFGIKTVLSDNSTETNPIVEYRELHDCGIVYYPDNPYFLCVMTRGENFDTLEEAIQNISKLV
jgi:hypothetical protein